jgi:soluble lytic murein transglycosylase
MSPIRSSSPFLALLALIFLAGDVYPAQKSAIRQRVHRSTAPQYYVQLRDSLSESCPQLSTIELTQLTRVVFAEASAASVDPLLILAMIEVESGGNRLAVSPVGALGLMQIRPETAQYIARRSEIAWHGEQRLFDPAYNVQLGVRYLGHLMDRFADLDTALAAYNWGPTRVSKMIQNGDKLPAVYSEKVTRIYRALGT